MLAGREVAMGFEVAEFVRRCRAARKAPDAPQRIAGLVREAIADPAAVAATVAARQAGDPNPPMADVFVNDDDLTIYHLAFPPLLFGVPHDHAGWAVIGVYAGAEAFSIYEQRDGGLVKVGHQVIAAPAVEILPPHLIHDIENVGETATGSIHVYANRHFDMPERRLWRDGDAAPTPFSLENSYRFGMERTLRRRRELGVADESGPRLPNVDPDA
jgi:predicted metal-dependent enzyme (double-stranded beta helix superfamily)